MLRSTMVSTGGSAATSMKVSISPIYACLITIIITLITLFSIEIPHPVHSVALAQYPPPPITEPSPYPEPPISPTNTPIPPTDTPIPPTNTPIPPTNTSVPPTDTPIPPTNTTTMPPTTTPTIRPTTTPTNTPTATSTPPVCNPEQDLSGQITSKGLFEITNKSLFCDYAVGVATYRLLDDDQIVEEKNTVNYYDANTATIKRAAQTNRPATLQLEVGYPSCATFAQHGFWGSVLESLDQEVYGERELDQQQFPSASCDSPDKPSPERDQIPDSDQRSDRTQRTISPKLEQSIDRPSSLNMEVDESRSTENAQQDEVIRELKPAPSQNTVDLTPSTLPRTGETDEQQAKDWLLYLSLVLIIGGIVSRRWKIGYNAR